MISKEQLSRIDEIKKLEHNWNGYGAEPIPEKVIYNTISFLNLMSDETLDVVPVARHSIQCEYEETKEDGYTYYIEYEIYENHVDTYYDKYIMSEEQKRIRKHNAEVIAEAMKSR